MQLHQLKSNHKKSKRVGRGGKRGFTSGKGTKGQRSRAGASIKPGFRGGDNRLWQLFPKKRGASSKPGNTKPHQKHRFYQLRHSKDSVLNLGDFNIFNDGDKITPEVVFEKGLIGDVDLGVKVLGGGNLKKKLEFEGLKFSQSAKEKALKAGAVVK